ncbi:hypothetical protein D6779_04200, partial [Candidatus Parcubacteria bacterium]
SIERVRSSQPQQPKEIPFGSIPSELVSKQPSFTTAELHEAVAKRMQDADGEFAQRLKEACASTEIVRVGTWKGQDLLSIQSRASLEMLSEPVRASIKALRAFDEQGALHVLSNHQDACRHLLAKWFQCPSPLDRRVIFTDAEEDASKLNQLIHDRLVRAGMLGSAAWLTFVTDSGVEQRIEVAEGERIRFIRAIRMSGIRTGSMATVTSIDGERITVVLDGGQTMVFQLSGQYRITYGYARVGHAGQSPTSIDHAFCLVGSLQLLEMMRHVIACRPSDFQVFASRTDLGNWAMNLIRNQGDQSEARQTDIDAQLECRAKSVTRV